MAAEWRDVVVVGAGLAGLACAAELQAGGGRVQVLDKSRGVSGRAATRRVTLADGREARLDHGARFFTARHPRTQALAHSGLRAGWLAEWSRGFPLWEGGQIKQAGGHSPRYAPLAGMAALGRHLARGLDVLPGAEVTSLEPHAGGWRLHTREGEVARAGRVVLNLPAPQVAALLGTALLDAPKLDALNRGSLEPGQVSALRRVRFAPCWAVGLVLGRDLDVTWPALRVQGHPVIEWISREHTKRPPGHPPALMIHATPAWSREHLEAPADEVQAALTRAAGEIAGPPPDATHAFAHRWRFATPETRAPRAAHWDGQLGLGWCGDWLTPDDHGPRVEAALLSGWALARQVAGEAG